MESGDFGDNLEIFLNARYQMKTGSHEDGLQTIQTLRRRIIATGEVKSNRWLVPTLDAVLSPNEPPNCSLFIKVRRLPGNARDSE